MENQTQPSAQNEPAVVKYNSPREVLIAARKLIETPDKWSRLGPGLGSGKFCCIEAINYVRGSLGSYYSEEQRIFQESMGGTHLGDFNDDPARTHSEVLSAFDRAIAAATGDPAHVSTQAAGA